VTNKVSVLRAGEWFSAQLRQFVRREGVATGSETTLHDPSPKEERLASWRAQRFAPDLARAPDS